MAQLTTHGVVREILSTNLELPADEVIRRAKLRGLRTPEGKIREAVHNLRSEMKRKKAKTATAPAAARETAAPKPAGAAPATPAVTALVPVFANVVLVNKVVGAAGGVENARQVAEAVRACGGVDPFLKHLDLVAGIRESN